MQNNSQVELGVISGHHGVRGWVKVRSYTRPVEQIFEYPVWQLAKPGDVVKQVEVVSVKQASKNLLVKLAGYDSREATEVLLGCSVSIEKSQLEALSDDEFYWMDLIGLQVVNLEKINLGKIISMMETGANDVAVVKSAKDVERLLPWVPHVIVEVNLDKGVVIVDWDEEY